MDGLLMAGSVATDFGALRLSDLVSVLVVGCAVSAEVGCGFGWLGFEILGILGNCALAVCKLKPAMRSTARVNHEIFFIFPLLSAGLSRQVFVNTMDDGQRWTAWTVWT